MGLEAATIGWITAAISAASAAASTVQQRQSQKQAQRNAKDQLAEQEKAQALQDEQWNKANARKADIEGLLEGNSDNLGNTNLTGAQGQAVNQNTLGSSNLLGG